MRSHPPNAYVLQMYLGCVTIRFLFAMQPEQASPGFLLDPAFALATYKSSRGGEEGAIGGYL